MAVSQILAIVALGQFAVVSYFLSREKANKELLASITKSNIPQILVEGKIDSTELVSMALSMHSNFIKDRQKFHSSHGSSKVVEASAAKPRGSSLDRTTVINIEGKSNAAGAPALKSGASMLTVADAMAVHLAKSLVKKFDRNRDGELNSRELQPLLRLFGLYLSQLQVDTLMASFRQSQGSSLSDKPFLDLPGFIELLCFLGSYCPVADPTTKVFSRNPSYIADYLARVLYPALYIGKVVAFFSFLSTF